MSNSKRAVSRCFECGELLYEGDTAYNVLGKVLCPGCVMDGEHICGRCIEYDADMDALAKDYNIVKIFGKGGVKGEQG